MTPGRALALIVLGAFFVTGNAGQDNVAYIITCLLVFMFFTSGGLQLMGWLTGSEIYPLAVRGAGTSVQSVALWSTNLLITLTLLTHDRAVRGRSGLLDLRRRSTSRASSSSTKFMPELTGHSLEGIEARLQDGKFAPADFKS